MRAIDLPHASGTDQAADFVGAEPGSRPERVAHASVYSRSEGAQSSLGVSSRGDEGLADPVRHLAAREPQRPTHGPRDFRDWRADDVFAREQIVELEALEMRTDVENLKSVLLQETADGGPREVIEVH